MAFSIKRLLCFSGSIIITSQQNKLLSTVDFFSYSILHCCLGWFTILHSSLEFSQFSSSIHKNTLTVLFKRKKKSSYLTTMLFHGRSELEAEIFTILPLQPKIQFSPLGWSGWLSNGRDKHWSTRIVSMKSHCHRPVNTTFLEEHPGTAPFHSSWEASYLLPGPSVSQQVEEVKIICVDYMVREMLHKAVVKKSKYNAMRILHWIRVFNTSF